MVEIIPKHNQHTGKKSVRGNQMLGFGETEENQKYSSKTSRSEEHTTEVKILRYRLTKLGE